MKINNLTIKENEKIYLDDLELKNVAHYEVSHYAGEMAKLTITLEVAADSIGKLDLHKANTCELVAELKRREGVATHLAEPYEDLDVQINGPAIALIITD